MERTEMVSRARYVRNTGVSGAKACEAIFAALTELKAVGDALGTDETGEALVAVARAAHAAEQEAVDVDVMLDKLRKAGIDVQDVENVDGESDMERVFRQVSAMSTKTLLITPVLCQLAALVQEHRTVTAAMANTPRLMKLKRARLLEIAERIVEFSEKGLNVVDPGWAERHGKEEAAECQT